MDIPNWKSHRNVNEESPLKKNEESKKLEEQWPSSMATNLVLGWF